MYCNLFLLLNIQKLELQIKIQMNIVFLSATSWLSARGSVMNKCPFVVCHLNDHFMMLDLSLAVNILVLKKSKS